MGSRYTILAFVTVLLAMPFAASEYYLSIINLTFIAIVGAIGLNILVGNTGQVSIGHGAFMSVGAYTAANLIVRLHAPFWVAIPAGGAMAALGSGSDDGRAANQTYGNSGDQIGYHPGWRSGVGVARC